MICQMRNAITKSPGFTASEKLLAELCDKTFLRLWSYPNVFKADGKELCDLVAVFDNHVFLFFVRESRKFDDPQKEVKLQWERWTKETINKQLSTLEGAEKYIRNFPEKVYLDQQLTIPFPISIPKGELTIHKIIVALGAKDACKSFSPNNISGSLAIGYGMERNAHREIPFLLHLDRTDPVHVFDSHNLHIMLSELDTVADLKNYLVIKEKAIKKHSAVFYCGEEDLLAHYFLNYNATDNSYSIAPDRSNIDALFIAEGQWEAFVASDAYRRRKELNKVSFLWDRLLQHTCDNALSGSLMGNANVFKGQSPICEMAREPRFSRRALSEYMAEMIEKFPGDGTKLFRHVAYMPSFYPEQGYVFLQLHVPQAKRSSGDRERRQAMLEIACGAAKNRFPHLKKIVGIAIDAPKYTTENSEDFILMECGEWTPEQAQLYEEENAKFRFFKTTSMKTHIRTVKDFPHTDAPWTNKKVSRNEPCPCGSGKKYKRCCGRQ